MLMEEYVSRLCVAEERCSGVKAITDGLMEEQSEVH